MKKHRLINILLTTIMVLNSIVTPQMAYAVSDALADGETEERVETNEDGTQVIDAKVTDEDSEKDNENSGAAEVQIEGKTGKDDAEDGKTPEPEGEAVDETPDDTRVNGPPAGTEPEGDTGDVKEEGDRAEKDTYQEDEAPKLQMVLNESQDLGNIFENPRLTLNEVKIENDAIIDIDSDTVVQLQYDWNTDGIDATNGDTASLSLPDIFREVNIQDQPVITAGVNVGTYSIIDGILTFTFNENIEGGNVNNGVLGLNLRFNMEMFEENIEQVIEFNDKDETTLKVIARPSGEVSGITKEGHPDRDLNAREITWTIDVINDNDEPISDASLLDRVPEGLGTPRDFKINELSVDLNGDKRVGAGVNKEAQVDGNKFTIAFENIAPFSGYRVQYTTTIEDYTKSEFTNEANFSYGDTELPAEATVEGLERSNPIQKSGAYNSDTHQIDWTITVNESGGEIDEAIVYDVLPPEQLLIENSIVVNKYDSNENWLEEVTIEETGFPINLGAIKADEIYQIGFSTNIDWTKVNNGEYQRHNQFKNKAELKEGTILVGEADASVDFHRESLLEKLGASNVNYDNNTLTWTVTVNKAKHPLSNVVVNDVIPEGLSISDKDISIKGENGEDYSADEINVDGQNVQINLGDIETETITIEYTTTITDFTIDAFDNKATLEGNGIGVGEPEAEDIDTIKPPANSFDKIFEGIDYSEQTMDWRLTVNPIREAITELTIVDTFPNSGMIMLPHTLKIRVGEEEISEGFTLRPNKENSEEGYHKGFVIEFDDDLLPLNAQMDITYQTSYDPQLEVEENTLDPHVGGEDQAKNYINHAQFTGKTKNGNDINKEDKDNKIVRKDAWNSGKKEGQLVHEGEEGNFVDGWVSGSERKIAWQVYTNYQDQNLGTGVIIEDELGYEGTIDEGSVVVSVYTVDAAGETTITNEILSDDNYKVDYSGDSFKLTFNDEFTLNERYVVQFTTTVPNISQPNYTNDATVWVGNDDYPYSGTVNYDRHDHFLTKGAVGVNNGQVFTGDEIDWKVTVNESLSIIENAMITDTISEGLVYVEGSLEITTVSGTVLEQGEDYRLTVSTNNENETVLSIKLRDTLTETLILNYSTVVTETDGQVNNTINLDGENLDVRTLTSQVLSAREFSWVGGDFNPNRGAIRVTKVDSEKEVTIENNEATFVLEFELNGERVQFGDKFTTVNGVLEIGGLPLRTYYLREVEAPRGYVIDETEQVIEVTQSYGSEEHFYEIEFTNTIEKTKITVTKEWNDVNDQAGFRPASIDVQLLADGQTTNPVVTLSEDNNWSYTWTELDAYYSTWKKINYTVDEIEVPAQYEVSTEVGADGNILLINTHVPETTDISVSKDWQDENNQDGIRPDNVTVNLMNGSTIVDSIKLSDQNGWQYTFANLPVYNQGVEIDYSITEDTVSGYSTSVEYDLEKESYVVSNNRTPDETSVTVTKGWDDENNQDGIRPSKIEVQLLADGEREGEPVTITATDNWTYTWQNLAENANGKPITYSVEEVNVPEGYISSINDADHGNIMLTNSYTPETAEISVSKEWDDADNQDGVRPDNVIINLLADGEIVRSAVVNADGEWVHTFTNLPVYDNGDEIKYTVTENSVANYSTEVKANPTEENSFVVTNSHTPDETSVTVTKSWNDSNNQDGNRPNSISLQLNTVDGEELTPIGEPVEVFAADNWTYTWSGLDANADGEAIKYTVVEVDASEDYEVSVNDADHGNIIITNSYTPELTEVSVLKVWEDVNDQDGKRPSNIVLNLLNGRGEIVKSAVVREQEGNEWEYTFTNLPKYENGVEIGYSVTENFVSDYSTAVEENEEGFQVITNSYTPEQTSVTVTKGWNDGNNQDGNRPYEIQVQLLADGEAHGEPVTLTASNGWTHTWNELDLNADGEAIKYSVEELNVSEEYVVSINDRDHGNIIIINNYDPELIEIPVQKIWDDGEDQDRIRPERVEVNLLANGEKIREAHITEATDWQHVFTNLPRFSDGEEINYTLNENTVEHYSLTLNEFNEATGMFEMTNSYTPEETTVTVTKGWEDANNQDGNRPESIEVQLLADGEPKGDPIELKAEGNWTYTWEGLALNSAGEPITYSVQELNVSDEYDVNLNDYDHGNIMLTNHYDPELIEISGTKIWDDADNQDGIRPESITVNLLADGKVIDSTRVTAADDWTFEFTEIPRFAEGEVGVEVEYTVEEETVEGYEVSIDGYDITNSYTPEVIEISGTKIWDDADNQDGIRPDEITLNLLANGVEIASQTVTAEDDWSYTFEGLARYENQGEEIEYTIEEEAVEGYEVSIDGYDITNSYTPEVIDITGSKTWDDADNQDGVRPQAITVRLLANGVEIDSVEVTEESDWTYEFKDIPKFENGQEIVYTVQEDAVKGYSTSIEGFEITNSHTPGQTSVNVVKSWNDNNNLVARPESITVNLLANGEQIDSIELTAENNWQADFTELDEYADGELIEYTVEEDTPRGFVTEGITGNAGDGFVITNRPAKVSVGDYVWFDANKDGLQDNTDVPLEGVVLTITDEEGNPVTDVYGNPVGPTVTDRNGWYTFDNLPIDNTYIVRINREAFEALYPEYVPTLTEEGDDRSIDSSEWIAISVFLDEDGQRDPTLDFGFVLVSSDPQDPRPTLPETGGQKPENPSGENGEEVTEKSPEVETEDVRLPITGEAATYTLLAVALLTLGGVLLIFERKRENR